MNVSEHAPLDYAEPKWDKAGRVHEWKNYISDEIRAMWPALSDEMRAALARQADAIASNESWD